MTRERKNVATAGVLFILAIVTLFVGQAFYNPFFNAPNYLDMVYPHRNTVIIGILVEFTGILGLVIIPVLLYPIMRRHYKVLALAYVSIRLFEAVLLSIAQICKLVLINISQAYLNTDRMDASTIQNIGNAIKSALTWNDSGGLIYLVVFIFGALIFYSVLYKSKLIPQWLSIWGLIGAVSMFLASLIATFDILPEILAIILMMPIPLQELTMAFWFIIKGLNTSAIDPKSINPA
jgi:hypothetical protein